MPGLLQVRQFPSLCRYTTVWQAMQAFTEERHPDTTDELWLLEHSPVYTLGQAATADHVLDAGTTPVLRSDRGGQVTWHGPGQLMAYTLLDTRRLHTGPKALVHALEAALIETLTGIGIPATRRDDAPGVYVPIHGTLHKIASLGLRFRQAGCYHGAALNLDCELAPFRGIHPCGVPAQPVTRVADLATRPWNRASLSHALAEALAQQLRYDRVVFLADNHLPG